ncbi:ABC transporter ATP-binding protein [Enterococcus xiangfangensis]|uniref:ABC transporter ATP-binding protein n=1 Tax=Enterococcus xiangfangensis TaxID=1296537 RepID=UPI0010F7AC35|nr:ABC transporter ATP-binding protein [Enterococcus xiangfangensis]MBM7712819.1 iron(III) transport system ATP-binding protein [Enterococcus xiangfangensis]NBK09148.1 ABC transporter ATP-binding protein [Enterococcus asini]
MFLEVRDLDKFYGTKQILKQVSFTVSQGEMLVILGPSGCGKSTLLSCLNGFEKISNGRIVLEEQEITEQLPEERDITTVFQSYSLFPHLNVMENLLYGLKFQKLTRAEKQTKGRDMLKLLRLTGYEKAPIQSLSGGQQQRVALGRSLIVEPKLLLLDEPLSNLDEKLRVDLRKEIRRIQKELQMTMIFVTHDQAEAFAIAERILLLDQGVIQQWGTGPEIYNTPSGAFPLEFIGESNSLDEENYVRPEEVTIVPDETGSGVIIDSLFQGATYEYQVQLVDGQILKVTRLNQGAPLEIGSKVAVSFVPKHINFEKGESLK